MKEAQFILVINPGSTSTKISLFKVSEQFREMEITHPAGELSEFKSNLEQLDYRENLLIRALKDWQIESADLKAAIGRGGPLKPMKSGVYRVGKALLSDLASGKLVDHASILGGLLASRMAEKFGIPAYIADPVSVDEFDDIARISGTPELPRISLSHALNVKAVAQEYASDIKVNLNDLNLIIAHLGGGISIASHRKGRLIDVNNANDGGPFSPERVGTLPLTGLLKMAFSGKYTHSELKKKLIGRGGLLAHLGTSDAREIVTRIESGDKHAELVFEAMAYQISKEIGAMATTLAGKVDAVILTGGLAHCSMLVEWIKSRVGFIGPVVCKPGQNEMKALARHALNALCDPGVAKEY